ncbi:hypothetical protein MMC17_009745 [Xylographa soralifera]|nr:hypothetical protein [Xylographa soralifera]
MIDRSVIPAFVYNDIRAFEEQDQALNPRVLKAIAEIFVRNQMQHRYSAGILHRHQKIEEGCVMVHTERSVDFDVCQSKSLNDLDISQLVPSSLFLNQNQIFQACEYDINGQEMELDHAFASQLRDFLVEYQLEKVIALIPSVVADGGPHDSIEFMQPDGNGTIRIPRHHADAANFGTTNPIITQWSFSENAQGIVECKGGNVCSPQINGKHRVFVDPKADHRGM